MDVTATLADQASGGGSDTVLIHKASIPSSGVPNKVRTVRFVYAPGSAFSSFAYPIRLTSSVMVAFDEFLDEVELRFVQPVNAVPIKKGKQVLHFVDLNSFLEISLCYNLDESVMA